MQSYTECILNYYPRMPKLTPIGPAAVYNERLCYTNISSVRVLQH